MSDLYPGLVKALTAIHTVANLPMEDRCQARTPTVEQLAALGYFGIFQIPTATDAYQEPIDLMSFHVASLRVRFRVRPHPHDPHPHEALGATNVSSALVLLRAGGLHPNPWDSVSPYQEAYAPGAVSLDVLLPMIEVACPELAGALVEGLLKHDSVIELVEVHWARTKKHIAVADARQSAQLSLHGKLVENQISIQYTYD